MAKKHHEDKIHGQSKMGRFQEYIGEFVYGGIDGSVTTFAVVAGATGGGLDSSVVIILGFANLIADGFSMSVGSYLSTKSEKHNYEKHKAIEYWEIEHLREREIEEVREIYTKYGFEGKLLEDIVAHIITDKDRWVEVMMKEELEMQAETKTPLGMGAATFAAFLAMCPKMFSSTNNTTSEATEIGRVKHLMLLAKMKFLQNIKVLNLKIWKNTNLIGIPKKVCS